MFSYRHCINPELVGKIPTLSSVQSIEENLPSKLEAISSKAKLKYNKLEVKNVEQPKGFNRELFIPKLPLLSLRTKRIKRNEKKVKKLVKETKRSKSLLRSHHYMKNKPKALEVTSTDIYNWKQLSDELRFEELEIRQNKLTKPSRLNKSCLEHNEILYKKPLKSPLGTTVYEKTRSPIISPKRSPRPAANEYPAQLRSLDISDENIDTLKEKESTKNTEFSVKGSQAFQSINSPRYNKSWNDLTAVQINFQNFVMKSYNKVFSAIDTNSNGFFTYSDVCKFVDSKINENNQKICESFWGAICIVCNKPRIAKSDFLSICSVIEHNKEDDFDYFNNLDEKRFLQLRKQLIELKELFSCYSLGHKIESQVLRKIIENLQNNEHLLKMEPIIASQTIDFSRFLRYLPFFIHLHKEITNVLNSN
ncbi:unnamed protein product [Blepharisma stoltei]|uniref:EF-hand domain-containing protein n=1 Tax=Blepharisma stoltei TaxID=1481888 RepID=A0AAU9JMY6_9CILI|nr:unnamed protein product [Blepharisma stoltei]